MSLISQNKTIKKLFTMISIFLLVSLACLSSVPNINSDITTVIIEEYKPLSTKLIADQIVENKLGITEKDLITLDNPIGEGYFIYVTNTNYTGVERFIIWVVIDGHGFKTNSPSSMITPNLPFPPGDLELWDKTNLRESPASDLIGYIFNGEQLNSYSLEIVPTNTPNTANKFGYSLDERKFIFFEIVEAEDQAWAEANLIFPTPDPFSDNYSPEAMSEAFFNQSDYFDEYSIIYKQELAEKYGLTMEDLKEIGFEGGLNSWPMPELP